MSSSKRSGCSASVRWMALSPSLAVPTSCAPSARASSSCSLSAASGSSSAMSTRNGSVSGIRLHRHSQRNLVPAVVHRAEAAARARAPARFEALADIGEPQARSLVGRSGQDVLAAVLEAIADFDDHPVVVQVTRFDADHHGLAALRYAVLDRILDDRL